MSMQSLFLHSKKLSFISFLSRSKKKIKSCCVPKTSFPRGSDSKESACDVGDLGSIHGLGRSPGGGHGNPLQYSCLDNPMDRGTWQTAAHGADTTERLSTAHGQAPFLKGNYAMKLRQEVECLQSWDTTQRKKACKKAFGGTIVCQRNPHAAGFKAPVSKSFLVILCYLDCLSF